MYERQGRLDEYNQLVEKYNTDRRAYLRKWKGLNEEIVNAICVFGSGVWEQRQFAPVNDPRTDSISHSPLPTPHAPQYSTSIPSHGTL
jgi:hypothetical protein